MHVGGYIMFVLGKLTQIASVNAFILSFSLHPSVSKNMLPRVEMFVTPLQFSFK